MVAKGEFREDLFYRLNVVPIFLPPLRERLDEIEPLARQFCKEAGGQNGKADASLADEAVALLRAQPWPGNVRELQNFIERLVILSDGPVLGAADVQRELGRRPGLAPAAPVAPGATAGGAATLEGQRKVAEKEAVQAALVEAKDNRSLAAKLLGVSRRTLYNKLEEHGLL
jgi:two-component system response regulator AtoC